MLSNLEAVAEDTLEFNPPRSTAPFLLADSFANFIVGPVGSTKTSVAIMKIAHEARRIAPCRDGIRRSRVAVIRNTRQMLYDTTIPDFEKWLGATGALLRTESKFLMRFEDVECEVLFRGLDDANDVRRLLSLQLTFGFMDEFREIHPDVYNALTGRLGRYPDKSMNKVGPCDDTGKQIHKLWGASNPPDADTWWEELLTEPPDNVHVTFQPSGMSPEADWLGYLPTGYYENLCEGKTEEWINVYVHGKFGSSLAGKPVFAAFDQKFHVAKAPLRPVVSMEKPLIIGMDFGLCYSDDTEVLTQAGWKFFKDVDERADVVATLNPAGFGLEYTPINFKVEYDYDGDLIQFRGQNFDFLVTPEHRTPYTTRDTQDRLLFASASELASKTTTHNYVQLQAKWGGVPMDWFNLPDVQAAAFLGWYLSEGSTECVGNSRRVSITQVKPCPELDDLITKFEWWPGTTWRKSASGWRATVPKEVGDCLMSLGKSWTKHAPKELLNATRDTIRVFLGAYCLGDGHTRSKAKANNGIGRAARAETTAFTVSTTLANHLQELILKAGWCSTLRIQKGRTTATRDGRKIQCPDIFVISVKRLARAEIQKQHISRVPYRGKIYCLNVPYHTLYVRRNGRPCWNGNTPACTINQQDLRGRFLTFAELTSENMGITRFLDLKLKPLLAERFPGHPVLIIGDPAGSQRSQTDERSVFEVIKAKGFTVVPARTNSVAARISAVESLLAGQVDGGARHLIDPSCKALIKALRGGYRYKIKKSGEMEDSPEKNESSHIADGHQYACLHVDSTFGSMVGGNKRRDIVRKAAVGWT